MKTLLVMRHAKSSWDNPGLEDHSRPLNSRGQKTAPVMGQLLKQKSLVPQLIISSPAVRAQETAQLVSETCGYQGKIETASEFYEASPEEYLKVLESVNEKFNMILIIGHNPVLESLLEKLSQRSQPFPTAAIAQLELPISCWKDITKMTKAKLVNLWRPKELE